LIFKEDGQEYAQVLRMLGNGRLEAQCIDGIKRLCHIRGKMRKKVWVNQGDIVLVGLRDYQDAKGDVILKYMADEARSLKQYGELPENIRVNDTDAMMEGEENENAEYVAGLGSLSSSGTNSTGSCSSPVWHVVLMWGLSADGVHAYTCVIAVGLTVYSCCVLSAGSHALAASCTPCPCGLQQHCAPLAHFLPDFSVRACAASAGSSTSTTSRRFRQQQQEQQLEFRLSWQRHVRRSGYGCSGRSSSTSTACSHSSGSFANLCQQAMVGAMRRISATV
jgi:translation initiation factor 1A